MQNTEYGRQNTEESPRDPLVGKRDRTLVPDRYKWDLADVYPDDQAWKAAREQLIAGIPSLARFRTRLNEAPGILLECLEGVNLLQKEHVRLSCYASMKSDLDTRDSLCHAMEQEMSQIGTEMASQIAYIEPEVLQVGRERIDGFLAAEPRLEVYRHVLDDILRKKEHTGSAEEERIVADAGLMAEAPGTIHGIFSNADFPFPEIELHDGARVKLDQSAFSLQRRSAVREDRRKVFAAFYGRLNDFRRTFGAQLYAEVRKNIFFTRARRYASCLERALDGPNIPVAVYHGLIEGVHAHLDTFHRYLELRRRLLGLEELHYYDLYAPLVPNADLEYTFDEATSLVLNSLTPLGGEYIEVARRALTTRWVDVYASDGKRSGAYSNGSVYDAHPYILLNYNGKYDDVSTVTHELGHTMHSYLANKAQPYPLSHYSIFVAEVASTFNEALLMEHMLRTATRDDVRRALLGDYLDGVRATVFRQVQFAEFEWRIHQLAEKGEALTGDLLNSLYLEIARKYYGHDKGICRVDDDVAIEWAYIPHFYYNFYVYQYATSFIASAAIAESMLGGDEAAAGRFLGLLGAGGSDYSMELLKRAGVDMGTAEPFGAFIRRLEKLLTDYPVPGDRA